MVNEKIGYVEMPRIIFSLERNLVRKISKEAIDPTGKSLNKSEFRYILIEEAKAQLTRQMTYIVGEFDLPPYNPNLNSADQILEYFENNEENIRSQDEQVYKILLKIYKVLNHICKETKSSLKKIHQEALDSEGFKFLASL